MQPSKIRVLIGDSSVRARLVLTGLIDAEPFFEVVDTACTQEELLHKALSSQPDLIVAHSSLTMSGQVPLFRYVYGEESSVLVLISQNLPKNKSIVGKFTGSFSETSRKTGKEGTKAGLMMKLKELAGGFSANSFIAPPQSQVASTARWGKLTSSLPLTSSKDTDAPLSVVVMGASTGGSVAIEYLVQDLHFLQPTVVLIAVHMPEKFTKRFAKRLQKLTSWRVEEGTEGMKLCAGSIVIAPGGQNMRVQRKSLRPYQLSIGLEPSSSLDTPSVDVLMQSAAQCAQAQVLGVILSGMGQDGTAGAREIVHQGGVVIAQNEETSTIFGMAKSAIDHGVVNGVFPLGQLNTMINRFVMNRYMSHELQQKLVG